MKARSIDEYPELMTTPEVAEVSRKTDGYWRKVAIFGGPIEPIRMGGKGSRLLWRKADLVRLLGLDTEPAAVCNREVEAM